ncbi:MAG: hypothetical protein DRN15_08850 [Thermoprotei archaeon]|nr:MAG: hypothetical protein DRN15_08850 [Thermoprotei archaeon]
MGGALEKLLEKARKEPEKYRDLLLEEKRTLEADLRHRFSWMIALAQLEVAYFSLFRAFKVDPMVIVYIALLLVIGVTTLFILYLKAESMLGRIHEILYGDPVDRWDAIFAMIYAIICGIVIIILALIG